MPCIVRAVAVSMLLAYQVLLQAVINQYLNNDLNIFRQLLIFKNKACIISKYKNSVDHQKLRHYNAAVQCLQKLQHPGSCFPHSTTFWFGTSCSHWNFSTKSRHQQTIRIDGKAIAQEIKDEIKAEVELLLEHGLRAPHLTVLLVGSDPASVVYVRNKAKAAEYTGITCEVLRLPESVSERAVLREINFLNSLPDVDGILVQLPLPPQINKRTICDAVRPDRDVDGFNVLNVGRFCVDQEAFMPATPSGVLEIMKRLKIETFGKNAVVCGRSKNVGMPIAMHLHSNGNATTTICHRNTPQEELVKFTRAADIIVTATGVPGLITSDMVSEGVIVIDVGITRMLSDQGQARLVGDVDYAGVSKKASMITPVPGGVGPVTVAMVIKNTLIAYKNTLQKNSLSDQFKK
ncbi:bifunctional protein fold [Plakobranchus ocellatus]|uniref:methenyltetrahydrofolate cyclohydrolase n=1 Tax=Plakobranchus ocellatus TaxID=259542 RepID=A0AAV4D9E4_9GAST|nr:bifunctional protein fold [Plakobranchus ocellatus]